MRGCHERESGQEKVVWHQLCKARMWEQSPREEGAQGPHAQERVRERGRNAHAREGERGGARPTREKEQEGAQGPRERERVGSEPTVPHQKGQCDREKAVKE